MTPTIVTESDELVMVAGASGGTHIPTATLQVWDDALLATCFVSRATEDFEVFGFALGEPSSLWLWLASFSQIQMGRFCILVWCLGWRMRVSFFLRFIAPFCCDYFVNYYCLLSPLSRSNFTFAGFAQCAGLRVQRGGGHLAAASSQPVPSQRELLVWGWPGARRCNCGIV